MSAPERAHIADTAPVDGGITSGGLVAPWDRFPIPRYAMLDVWMALGGEPAAFERMCDEPRRTPADTWAQLMAAIRNDMVALLADTNPPMGPEFVALLTDGSQRGED